MNEPGTKIYPVTDLNDANWEKYYLLSQNNKNDYTSYHMEHHIGRFNSIKKILLLINKTELPNEGEFLEFGTWKGHSFYNILNIMDKLQITNKTLTGIDGFIGIPEGYGHICCPDKLFNNTNYNECLNNIKYHQQRSFPNQKYNLLESLYKESDKILSFLKAKNITKVCFVHLDCDVIKSCEEVLDLLINNKLLTQTFFLHFDDWGIGTGIPVWFENYCIDKLSTYQITPLYETRITKSFKLTNNK